MWRKLHKVAYLKGERHEHHLDLHLFRMYFYFFCLHILNLVPSLTPFLCDHCWFYCYSFFSFLTSSQSFFHPSPTSIHLHITAHPASILSSLLQLLTILLRSCFLPPSLPYSPHCLPCLTDRHYLPSCLCQSELPGIDLEEVQLSELNISPSQLFTYSQLKKHLYFIAHNLNAANERKSLTD